MGFAGRKPKPPELHVLHGTDRPDRHPQNTPKPPPTAPSRPSWLLPEAKREWSRITPILHRLGLFTVVDRASLAAYCQAYARWRQAEEIITAEGFTTTTDKGNVIQRPEVAIARNMMAAIRAFAAEFGLTPSSRGRISLPEAGDDDEGVLD
ncbi:MAG: phage terminase small subunit P27 family [Spirochaetaceae bacterium]